MRHVLFVVLLCAVASPAHAKDPREKPPVAKHLAFEDDVVSGDLTRPDAVSIAALRHGSQDRLIRVRQDFVPELIHSCDAL